MTPMSAHDLELERVRAAKEEGKRVFERHGTLAGIGITRVGERWALRVSFAAPPRDPLLLPQEIAGVPVVVRVVGPVRKQQGPQA